MRKWIKKHPISTVALSAIIASLLYAGVLLAANSQGYCWKENRILSDHELVNSGVRGALIESQNGGNFFPYTSLEEFYAQNPYCCTIGYESYMSALDRISRRLTLDYHKSIHVIYRRYKQSHDGSVYYSSIYHITPCGESVPHSLGISESEETYRSHIASVERCIKENRVDCLQRYQWMKE